MAAALRRRLVSRLPPRAAWALWRAGQAVASTRGRPAPAPRVELAHVAWGVSEEGLEALVERLLTALGAPASSLLLVSDCDAVHVAAARGSRFEHVPPGADWRRAFPGGDYEGFLAARGRAIGDAYRIDRLEVTGDAPDGLLRGLTGARVASSEAAGSIPLG